MNFGFHYGFHQASGSTALANILYNMDTFNVDVSTLRTIDNVGSDGATADGAMYGSNHIYLGATQSVDIPLGYTLGSELVTNGTFDTDLTGWTVVTTPVTYDAGAAKFDATLNAYPSITQNITTVVSDTYLLQADMKISSVSSRDMNVRITGVTDILRSSTTEYTTISEVFTATATTSEVKLLCNDSTSSIIGYADNVTVKAITYTTQAILYYDVATKQHVSVTSFTDIKHTMTDSFSNLVRLSVVPTAGDLTALDANPEDIARMVNGVATVGTYSFTLADIEAFYPGNEGEASGDYTQNINVPLGAERVTNGDFSNGYTNWVGSSCTVSNGVLINVTTTSVLTYQDNVLATAKTYVLLFDAIEVIGGTVTFQYHNGAFVNIKSVTSAGSYAVLFSTTGTLTGGRLYINGGTITSMKIDNVSIKEVSSSPITNYTADCRTTYLNTNYGASNFLYTQDASGRLTGMAGANLIEFNGDARFVDLGFMPPSDSVWEMDIVLDTSGAVYNGIKTAATANRFRLHTQSTDGYIRLYLGDTYKFGNTSLGLNHARVVFDGSGGGSLTINNGTPATFTGSTYTYSATESFFLGMESLSKAVTGTDYSTSSTGYLKYYSRERTAAERTADYNSAKTLYPSLP